MYNMAFKHISLAGTATVGPKGQVVIPAEVREKMNLTPGDKLIALYVEGKEAVAFITEEAAQSMVNRMGEHVESLKEVVKGKN
jgi:AbrB family looped-hinge helix DNA binding protein